MRTALIALSAFAFLTACEEDPCSDYVDYICSCHADDDRAGYDCDTLRTSYQNADPELQNECVIALDEQVDQDADEGYVCDAEDSGL